MIWSLNAHQSLVELPVFSSPYSTLLIQSIMEGPLPKTLLLPPILADSRITVSEKELY